MPTEVYHRFVSLEPDGADATKYRPSDQNDSHKGNGLGVYNARDAFATGWVPGTTVDTDNINATIAEAIAAGGGRVFLPGPVHRIDDTLLVDPVVRMGGAGMKATILNMEDDTKYAIQYLSPLAGGFGPDSAPGIEISDMQINAKWGIRLNQDGDFSTVIYHESAIMAPVIKRVALWGAYAGDPDVDTAIVPTEAEMEAFGVGIYGVLLYDGLIDHCQIQDFGVNVALRYSDVNVIRNGRMRGGRYVYIGTSSEQNAIANNDLLGLGRVGGIFLDAGSAWATIQDNYFEAPGDAGQIIRTDGDVGTLIAWNRIDDAATTTPQIYLAPAWGARVTHNRFGVGGGPAATMEVVGDNWGGATHPVLCDWVDNQDTWPVPTGPGVVTRARDPYVVAAQNMLNVSGSGSASWPFIASPDHGRAVFQTTTYSLDFVIPLADVSHRTFRFRFTGRRKTAGGFVAIDYVEGGSTSLLAASLGFTVTTGVEVIEKILTIPGGAAGTGSFVITAPNTEVEIERIEVEPLPTQQAANADTSGATLAALETEVNQLKATLRLLGIIAP